MNFCDVYIITDIHPIVGINLIYISETGKIIFLIFKKVKNFYKMSYLHFFHRILFLSIRKF